MSKTNYKYCVAIRTLGLAGEKFQQELNSLINQTIPPYKIFKQPLIGIMPSINKAAFCTIRIYYNKLQLNCQ